MLAQMWKPTTPEQLYFDCDDLFAVCDGLQGNAAGGFGPRFAHRQGSGARVDGANAWSTVAGCPLEPAVTTVDARRHTAAGPDARAGLRTIAGAAR